MSDSDSEIEFNIPRAVGQEHIQNQDQDIDPLLGVDMDQDEHDHMQNAQGDHEDLRSPRNNGSQHERRDGQRPQDYNHNRRMHDEHVYMPEPVRRCPRPAHSITIKPDTFNGDDDWDQYISHFENCAELGQWTDRERALTLAACLKGQARVFYASLSAREVYDYKSLTNKLEQRFGSARQQSRWLTRLQSRRRLPNESIAYFGDEIRLMAQKAYPSLDCNAQEMLALQQFYKAVSLEMRCKLMDRDTKSISEAVEVVERYEELMNDGMERRRNVVRSTGHEDGNNQSTEATERSDTSLESVVKEMSARLERLEKRGNVPMRDRQWDQRRTRTCFLCNSPDHFQRNCPRNRGRDQRSQNFRQNPNSGNGNPSFL